MSERDRSRDRTDHIEAFDSTVQETYLWLKEIAAELGPEDRRLAYLALRGTLHALRDNLVIDESAQLAAQLPMLIRGIYFEGWDPSKTPARAHHREEFLERVGRAFARAAAPIGPEQAARAVFRVLSRRISAGEAEQVRQILPGEVRQLWPIGDVGPGLAKPTAAGVSGG